MNADLHQSMPKGIVTACAVAALAGIRAEPSRDDAGHHTVILTRGPWTREVRPQDLADALAEAKAFCEKGAADGARAEH